MPKNGPDQCGEITPSRDGNFREPQGGERHTNEKPGAGASPATSKSNAFMGGPDYGAHSDLPE